MERTREVYSLLAELLEYPAAGLGEMARQGSGMLEGLDLEASKALTLFAAGVEEIPRPRLLELYTATFDLNPACYPYAGYQLYQEDPKRAALMVKLRESYRACNYIVGNELPDHVAVLFGFLARQPDQELEQELLEGLLAPALEKMAQTVGPNNPYASLLQSALRVCGTAHTVLCRSADLPGTSQGEAFANTNASRLPRQRGTVTVSTNATRSKGLADV